MFLKPCIEVLIKQLLQTYLQLIINTSEGNQAVSDSFSIRRSALMSNIPHYTTLAGAAAAISAIESISQNINGRGLEVETLQNYFNN